LPLLAILPALLLAVGAQAAFLNVHFIDVGQGDCSLIVTPSGEAILIDGGKDRPPQEAGKTINHYLDGLGIDTLHTVVVTHCHEDHYGGLETVIREHPVKDRIYVSGYAFAIDEDEAAADEGLGYYFDFLEFVKEMNEERGLREYAYEIVSTLPATEDTPDEREFIKGVAKAYNNILYEGGEDDDDIELVCVAPEFEKLLEPMHNPKNSNSIVARLSHNEVSFLFAADIEREGMQAHLLGPDNAWKTLRSTVLKVPHHGSYNGSSVSFLQAVDPFVAIIQCGTYQMGNKWGHPHIDALALLSARAHILRNDEMGTIVVTSDGYSIRIKPFDYH
jgi:competence protein ComEC